MEKEKVPVFFESPGKSSEEESDETVCKFYLEDSGEYTLAELHAHRIAISECPGGCGGWRFERDPIAPCKGDCWRASTISGLMLRERLKEKDIHRCDVCHRWYPYRDGARNGCCSERCCKKLEEDTECGICHKKVWKQYMHKVLLRGHHQLNRHHIVNVFVLCCGDDCLWKGEAIANLYPDVDLDNLHKY